MCECARCDGLIFFVAKKKSKIWVRGLRYNAKINANFCLVISYFFLEVAKAFYSCSTPGNITFSVSAERCVVRWVIVLVGGCCLGCTVLAEKKNSEYTEYKAKVIYYSNLTHVFLYAYGRKYNKIKFRIIL